MTTPKRHDSQDPKDLQTKHAQTPATAESLANVAPPPPTIANAVRGVVHRLRSRYRNPFRKVRGLVPYRVDMGVDYGGSGPVFALGSGRVVRLDTQASWPGGHYIAIRLKHGPARGCVYYLAENLRFPNGLHVGSKVTSRTKIATLLAPFPHCETGWARDVAGFPPLAYGCYNEGDRTHAGDNFSDLLHKLGAPRGTTSGRVSRCALPPHWPKWK